MKGIKVGYIGKIYGKIGNRFFDLSISTDDINKCAQVIDENTRLKCELEKCYAEIADKERVISELLFSSNGCHSVKVCGVCGDKFVSDGNDCCDKCL